MARAEDDGHTTIREPAHAAHPAPSAKQDAMIAAEDAHGARNYAPLPVVLSRGEGVFLYDVDGKRYYDFLAAYGAANQGHCHPRIVAALREQAGKLTLTSRAFFNDQLGPFSAKLCTLFDYDRMLPMNSGAEAVETALKLARRWGYARKHIRVDRAKIVVFDGNFHGRTISIVSFSNDPESHDWYGPYTPGFVRVPYNDVDAMRRAMKDHDVCGLLVEPIQGEAGVVVPDEGFLRACKIECEKNEALLIADEIQTGLGRTGTMLAVEHERVRPDVLILGKALSGGTMPVSAVLADDDVMLTIKPGQHGSTYGGNPLACAVSMAALDVLVDERLAENAAARGEQLRDGLRAIGSPLVKEIRGRGLMNALVIPPFETRDSRGAHRVTAKDVCLKLLAAGLLAKPTHDDVIRLTPPLTITAAQVDEAVGMIGKVLRSY
jgi:ornithine--oxo-acid transaminase